MERKDKLALLISFIALIISITSWIESREATKANIVFSDLNIDSKSINNELGYIRSTFIFTNTGNEAAVITGGQLCIMDLNGNVIKRFDVNVLDYRLMKDQKYQFSIFADGPTEGVSVEAFEASMFFNRIVAMKINYKGDSIFSIGNRTYLNIMKFTVDGASSLTDEGYRKIKENMPVEFRL